MTSLRFLKIFENESVQTYAQADKILGVSKERVYQMTALGNDSMIARNPAVNFVLLLGPAEIRDFLAGAKDHAVLQHFTERRLRPLTIMPSDEAKIERFRGMLAEVGEEAS